MPSQRRCWHTLGRAARAIVRHPPLTFSSMKFRQPSLGTNAAIFLPFLISCTRAHLRMAELGCLASMPLRDGRGGQGKADRLTCDEGEVACLPTAPAPCPRARARSSPHTQSASRAQASRQALLLGAWSMHSAVRLARIRKPMQRHANPMSKNKPLSPRTSSPARCPWRGRHPRTASSTRSRCGTS